MGTFTRHLMIIHIIHRVFHSFLLILRTFNEVIQFIHRIRISYAQKKLWVTRPYFTRFFRVTHSFHIMNNPGDPLSAKSALRPC